MHTIAIPHVFTTLSLSTMLRFVQHACVAACIVAFRWDWLRVLFCYKGIAALNRSQLDHAERVRQKEALQHRALWRVLPLVALYVFVYLPFWHIHDRRVHENEASRAAARMQPVPHGCHLPDIEQAWNWDLHLYLDGILGTHWSETICSEYLQRVSQPLEPSYLEVGAELIASPFVVLLGALGKGLALFLAHQTILAWGALAMVAAVVFTLGPILAGPYLVLAGVWLRAHNPWQPKIDRFLARRQRAGNYIRYLDDDDADVLKRTQGGGVRLLREEGYKMPMAGRAVESLLREEEEEEHKGWDLRRGRSTDDEL